jgi:hypothetical protein
MNVFSSVLGVWATLVMPFTLLGAPTTPHVKTESGVVEGKDVEMVRAFLGIPYVAPA